MGKRRERGVKRVLVVGGSMIRGIEEDLGALLGKGFEVKVVCMSGGKTWDIRRHLGKWVKEKTDCMVVHVGTNHIQMGTGILDVGEFGKEAEKLIDEVDKHCLEGSRDVVRAGTEDGPRRDRVTKR